MKSKKEITEKGIKEIKKTQKNVEKDRDKNWRDILKDILKVVPR